MKNLKFSTKLLLIVLAISLASVIIVSTISYTELLNLSGHAQDANIQLGFYASDNSREALIQQAETYIVRLASAKAAECDATLSRIQNEIMTMAAFMGELYANPHNFVGRVLPLPYEVSPDYATAKMQVAPNTQMTPEIEAEMLLISNAEHLFSLVHAGNPNLSNAYMGSITGINFRWSVSNSFNPDFDPRERPWYMAAYESNGEPIWLDAHVDAFGYIITTAAQAFRGANGNIAGVVASDIHLSTMVENILNMRIGETGFAFLLDQNGNYLAHPFYDEIDTTMRDTENEQYNQLLQSMAMGNQGVRRVEKNGTEHYIAYAPLPTTGWSLGIAVEMDEIIADAVLMKAAIDNQAIQAREQIREILNSVLFRFILLTCVMIIAVLVLSVMVSGTVTKPILKLTNGVIEVSKGNLENKIDIQTNDEIGVLASHYNKMTDDLSAYITNLAKMTAEKERIGAELDVATNIQASMLPRIFPAFPEREEFDIHASMHPAKEVGGDFYDFFMIDDDHLGVVIADVSGKGVPAALFMVIAKTLINNRARNGEEPQDVFTNVNEQLCEDNDNAMFVTAWMGILQISTGKMTCVNGGHNPPALRKANGSFEFIKMKKGLFLASMSGIKYSAFEIQMDPGDTLYMYTDGVTESHNESEQLYGEERLLATLNNNPGATPSELLSQVKNDIDLFAGAMPQFDDITMLGLMVR